MRKNQSAVNIHVGADKKGLELCSPKGALLGVNRLPFTPLARSSSLFIKGNRNNLGSPAKTMSKIIIKARNVFLSKLATPKSMNLAMASKEKEYRHKAMVNAVNSTKD